eukprot:344411-Alexandrium_andersonii.AAC.1
MPASSASPELGAMVFWVADQCLVRCWPRTRTPPRVDLRARKHPAMFASTYAWMAAPSSCHGKRRRTAGAG